MPLLHIIIGSTRPGRVGAPVARWFTHVAREQVGFHGEVVDLAEVALPMLDEPHHPRLRQHVHQYTRDWSATGERADAFVIVTPEYNYGYPASVKNALNHVYHEWAYAPAGFVSYGGIAAGTRAVQQLKQVVMTLRRVPVFDSVNIPFIASLIHDDQLMDTPMMVSAAEAMLTELGRVEEAMHNLRKGAISTAG